MHPENNGRASLFKAFRAGSITSTPPDTATIHMDKIYEAIVSRHWTQAVQGFGLERTEENSDSLKSFKNTRSGKSSKILVVFEFYLIG